MYCLEETYLHTQDSLVVGKKKMKRRGISWIFKMESPEGSRGG